MYKKLTASQFFTLIIVPCIIFLLFVQSLINRGPTYSANFFDPDYAYLTNALDFLNLRTGMLFGHPGTPPQLFGAFIIAIQWAGSCIFTTCIPINEDVLANPESYLTSITVSSAFILVILIFLLGKCVFDSTNNLSAAVVSQISFLAIPDMMYAMVRFSAEPYLIIMVIITSIFIANRIQQLETGLQNYKYKDLLPGLVIGYGISVKITFAPLLLLGFFFAHPKKLVLFYVSALGGIIIGIIPILSHLLDIFTWFSQLAIKSGVYGSGNVGLPQFTNWIANLKIIANLTPTFLLLSIFYIIVGFMFLVRNWSTYKYALKKDSFNFLNIFFISTLIVQYIIVLKHYNGTRYLLPSMTLFLVLNGLFYSKIHLKINRVFFILFIILNITFSLNQINKWSQENSDYRSSAFTVEEKLSKDHNKCQRAYYYRSTSKTHALAFGNIWAYGHYSSELLKLYPETLIYDRWRLGFFDVGGTNTTDQVKKKLTKDNCLILIGSSNDNDVFELIKKTFNFEVIIRTKFDIAYKINAFL